jgi:archaellum component FlaC
MEDRILRLYPVIKELKVSDGINSSTIEMLLERVKVLENDIDDIRNGINGLKEINSILRKLVREVQDKL